MPLLLLSKSQPQGWVVILFNKGFFFGDSRSSFLFVTVDSNPHKRSQSPVCYLYTTPLNARIIIHSFSDLSTHFLLNFDVFEILCRLRLIIVYKQVHARPVAFQPKLLVVALKKALVHGV